MLRRTLLGGVLAAGTVAGVAANTPATAAAPSPAAPPPTPLKRAPVGPYVAPHWGLQKFRDAMPIPPVIEVPDDGSEVVVTTQTVSAQIHSQLPPTQLWTYNGSFPGPTLVTKKDVNANITWRNGLTGTLPLVGVKIDGPTVPALAAARQPGWRDAEGNPRPNHHHLPEVSEIEPWNVVHVHGASVNGVSDGWPTNGISPGDEQRCQYPNNQVAATLWYHDHAMDITRLNVHAGMAGFYLVKDDEELALDLPTGDYDVPLMINDLNLDSDADGAPNGQLLYKNSILAGATVAMSGPFNMVNGKIWPKMAVEAKMYRFRLVNASVSRVFRLKLVSATNRNLSVHSAIKIIGTDGGLLDVPQDFPEDGLSFAPAERFDLLIDFSRMYNRKFVLTNWGTSNVEPDIMRFDVGPLPPGPKATVPATLAASYQRLEVGTTVPHDHDEVFILLAPGGALGNPHMMIWEMQEITGHEHDHGATEPGEGRVQLMDPVKGKVRTFLRRASTFHETATLFFDRGRWTVWHFLSLGGAMHPMHIHLAQFQEIHRRRVDLSTWSTPLAGTTAPLQVIEELPIEGYHRGWKDTFPVSAGQWISVAGEFSGGTGAFMYHCHLLDHEDIGMMRPFMVRPASVAKFDMHGTGSHH